MFQEYQVTETPSREKVRKTLQRILQADEWYQDSFDFSRKYIYGGVKTNGKQPVEHQLVKTLAKLLETPNKEKR